MSNTTNRTAPKKIYTISNEEMLKLIEQLPTLSQNNKNTEFILSAKTRNDLIIADKSLLLASTPSDIAGSVNIRFNYDFVNDRWFLNDQKVEVINRERS